MTTEMEEVDSRGDSETVFHIVQWIRGPMKFTDDKTPTMDNGGSLILDQRKMTQQTQVWKQTATGTY